MKKLLKQTTNKVCLFFLLTSCGFSSGLYKDIIKAQGYIETREFKKAVKVYESILLRKTSKNIQIKIHEQLGDIYSIYLNDYEKGLTNFSYIVKQTDGPMWQVRALEKMAKIYFENTKEYEKSLATYEKLIKFIPTLENQNEYLFNRALSFFYLKRYKKAISSFKKLRSSSDSQNALQSYYYLGLSHFYMKNWSEANKFWFEYLKRETRKDLIIKTKFLIANSYESSEELKKAYNIYYSLLGEYPNPEVIKNRLESLYERRVARKR